MFHTERKGICKEPWGKKGGHVTTCSCWICIAPTSNRQAIKTLLFQDISLLYSANEDTDIFAVLVEEINSSQRT